MPDAASGWPSADRLFRSDSRWRGGDDAYSVPLPDGRILWLFGDTFIAPTGRERRADCAFIHNSVAIQGGLDPSTASIDFAWGDAGGAPTAMFTMEDDTYLWPLDATIVDGRLLAFFMQVRSTRPDLVSRFGAWEAEGSLGFFDVVGWQARMVDNPTEAPQRWTCRDVRRPAADAGAVLGTALLQGDGHLYAYSHRADGGVICRWPLGVAAAGDLTQPLWWDGRGWAADADAATVAVPAAPTEFTVHRGANGTFVLTETAGTFATAARLRLRWADRPEGPWSDPVDVFQPDEHTRPDVLLYAGKSHPQLAGSALITTYASNGLTCDLTLRDDTIYYPRFVRLPASVLQRPA